MERICSLILWRVEASRDYLIKLACHSHRERLATRNDAATSKQVTTCFGDTFLFPTGNFLKQSLDNYLFLELNFFSEILDDSLQK